MKYLIILNNYYTSNMPWQIIISINNFICSYIFQFIIIQYGSNLQILFHFNHTFISIYLIILLRNISKHGIIVLKKTWNT